MSTQPTPEQIAKLPAWAREYVADLKRQRDASVRTLNEFQDKDTPSPFYIEDHPCTGEKIGPVWKKAYIQSSSVTVEWRGVRLDIVARESGQHFPGIRIRWGLSKDRTGDVALIPESLNQARLCAKEDMR